MNWTAPSDAPLVDSDDLSDYFLVADVREGAVVAIGATRSIKEASKHVAQWVGGDAHLARELVSRAKKMGAERPVLTPGIVRRWLDDAEPAPVPVTEPPKGLHLRRWEVEDSRAGVMRFDGWRLAHAVQGDHPERAQWSRWFEAALYLAQDGRWMLEEVRHSRDDARPMRRATVGSSREHLLQKLGGEGALKGAAAEVWISARKW